MLYSTDTQSLHLTLINIHRNITMLYKYISTDTQSLHLTLINIHRLIN